MEALSWDDIMKTVVVIAVVFGGIASIWKGIEGWKNLSGATKRAQEMGEIRMSIENVNKRVDRIEETIIEHERRLGEGDKRFEGLQADVKQVLKSQTALLSYFISGRNDTMELQEIKRENDDYLINK